MATVTIIMPTYERATYLRIAIESALAQTYGDFVISIGDNSRNEDTQKIVDEFDDPRIRYTRHVRNLGQHANWLTLIDNADTPLVASLHDDDVWHPDFLEKLVPPMLADESVSMAFADFWVVDGDGARLQDLTTDASRRTHRSMLPKGRLALSHDEAVRLVGVWNAPQPAYCAVIRRQAVLDTFFPERIAPVYDLWLSYQIAARGEAFWYLPERVTDYRWHAGSSTSLGTWNTAEDAIFQQIVDDHRGTDLAAEVLRYWSTLRWGRAMQLMEVPNGKKRSRAELRAAAPGLGVAKRALATAGGYSGLAWLGVRETRRMQQRRSGSSA